MIRKVPGSYENEVEVEVECEDIRSEVEVGVDHDLEVWRHRKVEEVGMVVDCDEVKEVDYDLTMDEEHRK